MMNQSKREYYIDCLRGICIFLVLYSHMVVMGMRDSVDGVTYFSTINRFSYTFFLPLFFFISGFVSTRLGGVIYNKAYLSKAIEKKVRGVLIPTITMFLICMAFFRLNIMDWIFDPLKCGYWFTWVSFQIYFLWLLITMVTKKLERRVYSLLILIISLPMWYIGIRLPESNKIVGFLSTNYVFQYFGYFAIGSVCKIYKEQLHNKLHNKYVMFLLFVFAFAPCFFNLPKYWIAPFVTIPRLLVLYAIVYTNSTFNTENNFSTKFAYFGRHTLEIYFLHYFLLFKVDGLALWLNSLQNDYCFRGHSSLIIPEILTIGSLALVIMIACIIIRKVVDMCPIISELCFGPQNRK